MATTPAKVSTDFDITAEALELLDRMPPQLEELLTQLAESFAAQEHTVATGAPSPPVVHVEHVRRAARVLEDAVKLYLDSHPEHGEVLRPVLTQMGFVEVLRNSLKRSSRDSAGRYETKATKKPTGRCCRPDRAIAPASPESLSIAQEPNYRVYA
ncbi:hypothetical protein [Thermogutta sp.]|uniref:hypothetical protein n=1 Tax=Thermogutta sp. TaxID=1962930 RepID=UPI00321FE7C6